MSKYKKEELEDLILKQNLSYVEIGRIYNVSGNAIRKTALHLDINLPQRRKVSETETFNKGVSKSKVYEFSDKDFIEIIKTHNTWVDIVEALGYSKQTGKSTKDLISRRCYELQIELNINTLTKVELNTKGELFNTRKNWQSARTSIQKGARKIYFINNINPCCKICGYNNHIEVAHIKAVSEFTEDTPISVINSIENLIGLCPNHHWEYDNGILTI